MSSRSFCPLALLTGAIFSCPATAAPQSAPQQLAPSEWASLLAAHDAALHRVVGRDGGYEARNPGQRWSMRFDGRGFATTPDAGGWQWGLELLRYGWGDQLSNAGVPRSTTAYGGRVAYAWDGRLTEWYDNGRRGLEHGYTVAERPVTANGTLVLELAVRGGLLPAIAADGRDVRFVDAHGEAVVDYAHLSVRDAGGRELAAAWQEHGGGLRLEVDDFGACYPLTIDPIATQQAYLKASNSGTVDQFGSAVAVAGDTVVVGAPGEGSAAAGVNGNQLDNSMGGAGAAYVFVRSGTNWSQQAYLKASNPASGDQFGQSVAIAGDTIVVGAWREDSNAVGVNGNELDNSAPDAGAAYVFVRNGTTWSQQAYLKASNTGAGDLFGQSVAIAGDTIAVGAYEEDSNATGIGGNQLDNSAAAAGAGYVFVRSGTTWSQQAYLKASNTDPGDRFGWSVAASGETIVVGATLESSSATGVNGNQVDNTGLQSGAAYVFVRSGTTWSQEAYLKASNTGAGNPAMQIAGDNFGQAVAVDADTIVVGALFESSNATTVNGNQLDNSALGAGAAYVFVRSGAVWSQQAYLKASNAQGGPNFFAPGDRFGNSVAVSGNAIVVGAPFEDSNATGVNGDQTNNTAFDSGAAYVFTRNGTTWTQTAYVKASNTGSNDAFGRVALDGSTIVVGAPAEASAAVGVNGNQSDNSLGLSGAAYVLELTPPNDECAGALPLALGVNAVSTTGATASALAWSCGTGGNDVWYTFSPASTAPHSFDTCSAGTTFDTQLELYSGSCGALVSLACSDNACGTSAAVTAPLTVGATYYLRLGGSGGITGSADILVATGTGTGTITPSTTVSLCPSPATFSIDGNPNIGNTVVLALQGASGLPFVGYGFPALLPLPLPCGCDLISDGAGGIGYFDFASSRSLTIPLDPFFIGVAFFGQGLDLFATAGGCTFGLTFGLTDIWTVTIG